MNDHAKAMQASNDTPLAQHRIEALADEARAYIDNAARMLALVRQRMVDVEIRALKAKAALKHRYQDELNRIEHTQHADFDRLTGMEHRLLAMMEEH